MFGRSLLVQILGEKQGATVTLPKDSAWYHLLTKTKHYESFKCQDSQMAIFVKDGSIIPRYKVSPGILSTEDLRNNKFYFEVFGTEASGEVYIDDMKTLNYEKGEFKLIKMCKQQG